MSLCKKCGGEIPDGFSFCPYCGANNAEPLVNGTEQAPYGQPQYQQPQYQQPPYQQPPYQQPPYAQPQYQIPEQPPYSQQQYEQYGHYQQTDKAKTLGIVAIVFAFLIPLVSWICGGIGIGKCNKALDFAQLTGDFQLQQKAESSKRLAIIGIVVSIIMGVLSAIARFAMMSTGIGF